MAVDCHLDNVGPVLPSETVRLLIETSRGALPTGSLRLRDSMRDRKYVACLSLWELNVSCVGVEGEFVGVEDECMGVEGPRKTVD